MQKNAGDIVNDSITKKSQRSHGNLLQEAAWLVEVELVEVELVEVELVEVELVEVELVEVGPVEVELVEVELVEVELVEVELVEVELVEVGPVEVEVETTAPVGEAVDVIVLVTVPEADQAIMQNAERTNPIRVFKETLLLRVKFIAVGDKEENSKSNKSTTIVDS